MIKMRLFQRVIGVAILFGALTGVFGQDRVPSFIARTKSGYLVAYNRPTTSVAIEFKGEKLEPMDSDHPKFMLDGKRLQIVVATNKEFWNATDNSKKPVKDEDLLEAHKVWEGGYLNESAGSKVSIVSEFLDLTPTKKMMSWTFTVPASAGAPVSDYIFLTTALGSDVLALNVATETSGEVKAFRAYLAECMKTLKTSDKPFDPTKVTENGIGADR